ncbi:hypothetical protein FRACYDRAFT_256949 [Fragilariopsis cylindrus CCMP1102]|uniref:Malectin domain-containing protein n=1 Tax=Fragilariopsis cylindrus CCMP1102 TaxID=635003 RepID=A0A1E7EJE9_9STRA|nr:hypothetical protein FRACYDRAFT_256949 [Fragilariopsis cylindrus CCMP1102]|eukprot:OEU06014.1 hypothetical protein FRACYDRAFT_256949 [Fragilariopsis cylindrus CCMP1102]
MTMLSTNILFSFTAIFFFCHATSISYCVTAQDVEEGTTDLGGGVVTRTDVEYLADFSLDVRDIDQSIAAGNNNAALQIYLNGKHSQRPDGGNLFKLTELSTN